MRKEEIEKLRRVTKKASVLEQDVFKLIAKVEAQDKEIKELRLKQIGEEDKDNTSTVTFYNGCDSDCGYFQFSVLLNDDDGLIWEDTQSITYYPDGQTNKNNIQYWDNPDFLREVLRDKKINEYSDMPQITKHHQQNLVNLLEQVHGKGWL